MLEMRGSFLATSGFYRVFFRHSLYNGKLRAKIIIGNPIVRKNLTEKSYSYIFEKLYISFDRNPIPYLLFSTGSHSELK